MLFRLIGPDGQLLEQGEGTAEIADGSLVVSSGFSSGSAVPPLRVLPSDIAELTETEQPYGLVIRLSDGSLLELSMLGRMRGQVLAELREARAARLTSDRHAGGIGVAASFTGAADEIPAEFKLYDDALVVVGSVGDPERIPYSFVTGVTTDVSGYRLTLEVWGRRPLTIGRLAQRTTDFSGLLEERVTGAAIRTSSFLAALLPRLGSLQLRSLASALRDGLAAPRARLDAIDPDTWPTLVSAATRPERVPALRALESLGEMWLGFTQTTSVERPAVGVQPWRDSTRPQNFYGHGGDYVGFGGLLRGTVLADGPSQMPPPLAMWLLGWGGAGPAHAIKPRADVERGRLTPATTDYAALKVSGHDPAVMAFVFCRTSSNRVIYEVLNHPAYDTYVYESGDVPALNRALDLIRFHASDSPFTARLPHTETWPQDLQAVLS